MNLMTSRSLKSKHGLLFKVFICVNFVPIDMRHAGVEIWRELIRVCVWSSLASQPSLIPVALSRPQDSLLFEGSSCSSLSTGHLCGSHDHAKVNSFAFTQSRI